MILLTKTLIQKKNDTMAMSEIDSFVFKFKNLLITGRNTTLKFESKAGKAEASLHVDLGAPLPPSLLRHHHHHGPRDGPSRQRRRLRRAAEREAAAEVNSVPVVTVGETETINGEKESDE